MGDVEKFCPDALWSLAKPLLPEHPQRHQGGGRRRIDNRTALAAITYVLQTGCPWDALPESFPISRATAHRRFTEWVEVGVMDALQQATLDVLGTASSRLVAGEHRRDARSSGKRGNLTGPSPVDRGKPGSKVHAISDRNGLPLHADISAANVNDHKMLEDVVDGIYGVRQPVGRPRKRPAKLHGDKGYDYRSCRQALARRRIKGRIARKGIEWSESVSVDTATSSNAAWSGSPGSVAWPAATNTRVPTSSDSCAWHAP